MRGWSWNLCQLTLIPFICPAYAGLILYKGLRIYSIFPFVPRMRGWSLIGATCPLTGTICPAYAGMIPRRSTAGLSRADLSRVCGDDPWSRFLLHYFYIFVPRMRGWSLKTEKGVLSKLICPAYAGMIPKTKATYLNLQHLSRVCGDDPIYFRDIKIFSIFVPRMRGWSHWVFHLSSILAICPAYAGMIPLRRFEKK